jgi:hypothetical protein
LPFTLRIFSFPEVHLLLTRPIVSVLPARRGGRRKRSSVTNAIARGLACLIAGLMEIGDEQRSLRLLSIFLSSNNWRDGLRRRIPARLGRSQTGWSRYR